MMIGKAGPLPTAPKEKTIFVEDLPPDQRRKNCFSNYLKLLFFFRQIDEKKKLKYMHSNCI